MLSSSLLWSSNSIIRDDYVIDAETREFRLRARYGLSDNQEIGLELPLIWRGGGVLDGFIDGWHKLFGLPEGGRDRLPRDEFRVFANQRGETRELAASGFGLGNLKVTSKYTLVDETPTSPTLSLSTELSLPTAKDQYGHDGVDLLFGLTSSKDFGKFSAHAGAAMVYFDKPKSDFLDYQRFHAEAFLASGVLLSENVAVHLALFWVGEAISGIEDHPAYALYLDTSLRINLDNSNSLVVGLRENPGGGRGSSDVSFLVGLDHNLN